MSNISLKEQLEAVASQISTSPSKSNKTVKKAQTPIEQKKSKPKWLEYVQYGVELLRAYFPQAFKIGNEIKPLKVGIKQDLVKKLGTIDTIVMEDKACMVKSLSYYVNTLAYHRSIIVGANRIDLDGNPEGIVTEAEANYSKEKRQNKLRTKQQLVESK